MALGWFGSSVLSLLVLGVVAFVVLRRRLDAAPARLGTPTALAAGRLADLSFAPVLLAGTAGIAVVGGLGRSRLQRALRHRTVQRDSMPVAAAGSVKVGSM
jgi:hypothetical protein